MSLDGVEKTVRMLLRRGCLVVRSRSWRRQPEKLGCQQKTVCTMVQPDDWWQKKSGEDVGRPYQRYSGILQCQNSKKAEMCLSDAVKS